MGVKCWALEEVVDDMLKTAEGTYRAGRVELAEEPAKVPEETPVLVTFLEAGSIQLAQRGIGERQAGELRACLARFAEEWDSPEMAVYDH
jgi:hypothetical protein